MKYSEIILLLGLSVFAGVLFRDSLDLAYFADGGFGPGFIPRNFAVATMVLAAVLIFRSVRGALQGGAKLSTLVADMTQDWTKLIAPVGTILILFVATYFMEFGSVLLPLGVTITIVSAVFLGHSWIKSVILTVLTLAVIYAIFSLWLNIPVI